MIINYTQIIRKNDIKIFEVCIELGLLNYCIIILYDEELDIDNRKFRIDFQEREPWYIGYKKFKMVNNQIEINDNIIKLLKSNDKLTQTLGIELFKQTINYE